MTESVPGTVLLTPPRNVTAGVRPSAVTISVVAPLASASRCVMARQEWTYVGRIVGTYTSRYRSSFLPSRPTENEYDGHVWRVVCDGGEVILSCTTGWAGAEWKETAVEWDYDGQPRGMIDLIARVCKAHPKSMHTHCDIRLGEFRFVPGGEPTRSPPILHPDDEARYAADYARAFGELGGNRRVPMGEVR